MWHRRQPERDNLELARNVQSDAQTLRALREAGADLNKVTDVEFYLYFRTREAAERAAHSAQLTEFSATVKPGADGKNWLCLLSGRMVPSENGIRVASTQLQALADLLDGDYDGWEAKVTK
jgi:Regulator of ribonuclease activity B